LTDSLWVLASAIGFPISIEISIANCSERAAISSKVFLRSSALALGGVAAKLDCAWLAASSACKPSSTVASETWASSCFVDGSVTTIVFPFAELVK